MCVPSAQSLTWTSGPPDTSACSQARLLPFHICWRGSPHTMHPRASRPLGGPLFAPWGLFPHSGTCLEMGYTTGVGAHVLSWGLASDHTHPCGQLGPRATRRLLSVGVPVLGSGGELASR